MSDLRAMMEKVGLEEPKTLILSGNIVFKSASSSAEKVEQIARGSVHETSRRHDRLLRAIAKEWQAIIDANPFPNEAKSDPARLVMMCLRDAPSPAKVKALQAAIKGREIVRARGRQAYFVYPDGQGRSKLTIPMIEKALGTRGTARNWNTVLKLGGLAK